MNVNEFRKKQDIFLDWFKRNCCSPLSEEEQILLNKAINKAQATLIREYFDKLKKK